MSQLSQKGSVVTLFEGKDENLHSSPQQVAHEPDVGLNVNLSQKLGLGEELDEQIIRETTQEVLSEVKNAIEASRLSPSKALQLLDDSPTLLERMMEGNEVISSMTMDDFKLSLRLLMHVYGDVPTEMAVAQEATTHSPGTLLQERPQEMILDDQQTARGAEERQKHEEEELEAAREAEEERLRLQLDEEERFEESHSSIPRGKVLGTFNDSLPDFDDEEGEEGEEGEEDEDTSSR